MTKNSSGFIHVVEIKRIVESSLVKFKAFTKVNPIIVHFNRRNQIHNLIENNIDDLGKKSHQIHRCSFTFKKS